MATITLYKDKLNGVGGLIDNIVKSSNNLETQLGTLKSTLQGVNSSTYDLQDTVNSISSSSKTEKEKVSDLKKLNKQVTKFITTTVSRDNSVRDEINKSKKDFYSQYSYLKPECEKNVIEKIVDKVEQAAEWCAKHWKLIATAVIVVVAIALIATGVGAGIGGPLLVGACWGAITGAVIGGVAGGLESISQGGSFLDGFENGAFSGAVGGAIGGAAFAGLGAAGAALGKGISCASKLGAIIKGTAAVSKVLSLGMAGFDLISLADMAIDGKNNPIADLNKKLHSNKAYNIFQGSVSALAVFTGGMTTTMKCFVAGTLILTAEGLKRIEEIKAGDRVLSADTETMISEYKTVLETFVRRTNEIIHIFIENEEITTTVDHPFWVNGKGFVPAMNLVIGSELINDKGDIVCVENIRRETNREGVEVFNFKVEECHTYYITEKKILVHNAGNLYARGNFRKTTLKNAINEAPKNENGEMICPTCGKIIPNKIKIQTKNGIKVRRGYDLDHYPSTWSERVQKMKTQDEPPTRKMVLDIYNKDVRIQCPECDQGHMFEGIKGDFTK